MSYNGSGTFSLVAGNPVVTGTTISSTWANNTLSDIATGLSTCLTKDGQQTVTANIPIGGFKLTGIAAATTTGDALSYGRAATVTTLAVTSTSSFTGAITATGGGTLTGSYDYTGATITVPTQSAGDSSTKAASTAFVAGTAFSSALPAQTGASGKVVTTNGSVASWTANLLDGTMRFANTSDTTKLLAFDVSGVTTGTTRTLAVRDVNGSIVVGAATLTNHGVILGQGTGAVVATSAGSSGQVLTSGGASADPSFSYPGLTLLANLTPTAAANVDFLSTFSSSFDSYLIIGTGIKPAADDVLTFRLANAGTVDSGSNYVTAATDTGGAITGTGSSQVINTTTTSAGKGISFSIWVYNANDATNLKTYLINSVTQNAATPSWEVFGRSGAYFAAAAVSGMRLYWAAASNFSAVGNVRIFGIKNS